MRKIFFAAFALIVTAGLVSCAMGPTFNPELKLPEKAESLKYDAIVVSNFFHTSQYTDSQYAGTSSAGPGYVYDHYRITSQTSGYDASADIAATLRTKGIKTRAAKKLSPEKLSKGELMLVGQIAATSYDVMNDGGPGTVGRVVLFFLLIGNVLPNPLGFDSGADITYSYELIDPSQNIVYHSGTKRTEVRYRSLWVWGLLTFKQSNFEDAKEAAFQKIYDEIAMICK